MLDTKPSPCEGLTNMILTLTVTLALTLDLALTLTLRHSLTRTLRQADDRCTGEGIIGPVYDANHSMFLSPQRRNVDSKSSGGMRYGHEILSAS